MFGPVQNNGWQGTHSTSADHQPWQQRQPAGNTPSGPTDTFSRWTDRSRSGDNNDHHWGMHDGHDGHSQDASKLADLYTNSSNSSDYTNSTNYSGGTDSTGYTNSTGSTGYTDSTGSTGYTDSTGSTGYTDSTGSTGSTSSVTTTGSGGSNASLMGAQVNFGSGDTISSYEQRTGTKPTSVGNYIGASNGTLDMSTAESTIDQAAQAGVGTVQLSVRSGETGAMSQQELSQFTQLAQEAKSKGVNLQVRFGYEMNLSSVSGYANDAQGQALFKSQFEQVADAVHQGGGQMVWCPSNADPSTYQSWMPDPSSVDVVGLDIYHMGSGAIQPNEVQNAVSGIESVSGVAGKPFEIPETGVQLTGDGSDASKVTDWLNQLSAVKSTTPNYTGFMWFDYNKPGDGNYALSQNSQYEQALTQWYDSNS